MRSHLWNGLVYWILRSCWIKIPKEQVTNRTLDAPAVVQPSNVTPASDPFRVDLQQESEVLKELFSLVYEQSHERRTALSSKVSSLLTLTGVYNHFPSQ